MNCWTPNMKPM